MIPNNQALVPLLPERQAALHAIAETENRRQRGKKLADYPYACAFFRHLSGSRRPSLTDFRFFSPALTANALRGNRSQWLNAVDMLIESQGKVCWLPLPCDAADRLFPSVGFRDDERQRQRSTLADKKYTRQYHKETIQRELAYQALAGQAEIDLAFHTPETVGSWLSRWSGSVQEYDLESMFLRWNDRFPSLVGLEQWTLNSDPLWRRVYETTVAGKAASVHIRDLERWIVPNKLGRVE